MRVMQVVIAAGSLAWMSTVSAQVAIPPANPVDEAFFADLSWLWLVESVAVLALPLYLLISGHGAAIVTRLLSLARGRTLLAAAMFSGLYAAFYTLVMLPIGLLRGFQLNGYYGIPDPEIPSSLINQLVQGIPIILVAMPLGLVLFWLIRKTPRSWWVWVSALVTAFSVGNLTLEPLLNSQMRDYVPLASSDFSDWQDRTDALLARAGQTDVPVFVWQTTDQDFCRTINGVVGLGPTRRIVLGDQIFSEWDAREIDAAFAHELKHYLFDNTWVPPAIVLALSLAGGLFVFWAGSLAARRWSTRMGFDSLASPAALPLLLLLLQGYLLLATPLFLRIAQHVELEADRFALELTRDNDARARLSTRQCGFWLPEDTLHARLYLHTHPSMAERVRLANEYRPWTTGDPLHFEGTILE